MDACCQIQICFHNLFELHHIIFYFKVKGYIVEETCKISVNMFVNWCIRCVAELPYKMINVIEINTI